MTQYAAVSTWPRSGLTRQRRTRQGNVQGPHDPLSMPYAVESIRTCPVLSRRRHGQRGTGQGPPFHVPTLTIHAEELTRSRPGLSHWHRAR